MGRTLALTVASTLALLGSSAAYACDGVYDTGAMIDDLTVAEDALRASDGAAAAAAATQLEANIACLGEPMPYAIVGRIYRGIASGKVLGGDEARGRQWYLTALEADPTYEYGTEDMPEDSPIRLMYLDLRSDADADPVTVDASFIEGKFFIDGAVTGSPRATSDRPHLVQQEVAGAVNGWLVEGVDFPAEVLGAAVAVVDPETADPRDARRRQKEAERAARDAERAVARGADPRTAPTTGGVTIVRAPEKTPLIVGGAVALAAAGGLYYASSVTRKQFDDALFEDDARKARRSTNNLVIASAIVAAAGASALTWGIIVDEGPGVTLRGRF